MGALTIENKSASITNTSEDEFTIDGIGDAWIHFRVPFEGEGMPIIEQVSVSVKNIEIVILSAVAPNGTVVLIESQVCITQLSDIFSCTCINIRQDQRKLFENRRM